MCDGEEEDLGELFFGIDVSYQVHFTNYLQDQPLNTGMACSGDWKFN